MRLFDPDHERTTPVPDALLGYESASPREQLRRARAVLVALASMHREERCSLAGGLSVLERVATLPAAPLKAARRVLCAVVGTSDLAAWEHTATQAARQAVLVAALAHCAPAKGRWLAVAP